MVGYTEVLQTMAAMIIFSMILLNANRMIHRNNLMQVEGELEQEIVALAQDIIEEGRTKEFDELVAEEELPPEDIPYDFTAPENLGPDNESADSENSGTDDDLNSDGKYERHEFDDFDDYHGWADTLKTEHGDFYIRAEVFYVDPDTYEEFDEGYEEESTFKKMKVIITSDFLTENNSDKYKEYYLEFIRNYYAD